MTPEARKLLEAGAGRILGRPLTPSEALTFSKYMDLLVKWNSIHRLVGSADPEWIVRALFLDSLLFLRVLLHRRLTSLLDLGAGAGLPGIPLKIVSPDVGLTCLESRRRRASFLSTVVRELGLSSATVVNERAEVAAESLGPTFDAVVMRCAGDPGKMIPLAVRFLSPGGLVVVAGPPEAARLEVGRWVTVEGLTEGSTRRFAVADV